MEDTNHYLNHLLKEARISNGYTRRKLAEKVGSTTEQIYKYEVLKSFPTKKNQKKIARALGVSLNSIFPKEIRELYEDIKKEEDKPTFISLDEETLEIWEKRHGSNLHSYYVQTNAYEPLKRAIESALKIPYLPERRIIRFRFGLGKHREHTFQEIGDKMGFTRENIRKIQERALRKISGCHAGKRLEDFLHLIA